MHFGAETIYRASAPNSLQANELSPGLVGRERAPVLVALGTRPEAIKLAPVIMQLAGHPQLRPVVVATGQHRQLVEGVLRFFDITPDYQLNLMRPGQTPEGVLARALEPLGEVIAEVKPRMLVIQGDTVTTLAAGLAGFYAGVPVAHVEAGLRTGDLREPFPEEGHRRLVAPISALHFAPTPGAAAMLLAEATPAERVQVTGNTCVDALLAVRRLACVDPALHAELAERFAFLDRERPILLATAHRRENHGAGMAGICAALARIASSEDVQIVFPVHPNPAVFGPVYERLNGLANVHLVQPLEYHEFVWMLEACHFVLTDSGGVQEEAPALGRPVLVLRDRTERVEAEAAGVAKLVGTDPDRIEAAVRTLLHDPRAYAEMARAVSPYGDGRAAERIVSAIAAFVAEGERAVQPRQTQARA